MDDMKKRLKEMEDEAAALREMQAKVESQMGSAQGFLFVCIYLFFFFGFNFTMSQIIIFTEIDYKYKKNVKD